MIGTFYVRCWQKDQPREGRTFDDLAPGHPAFHAPCFLCHEPLGDGTPVQLLVIGPDNEEAREKHAAGDQYLAAAMLLHARCLTGVES